MTTSLTVAELERADELDLGASSWLTVDQSRIDAFAEATGDRQWIHVDPERAAAGPFGATVAHGYLTLSLLPILFEELLEVSDRRLGLNYGVDRIRFTAPVRAGSRIRLRARLRSSERRSAGVLARVGVELELEGSEKPALVGEILVLSAE